MRITAKKHFYVRFERTAYSCPNYALQYRLSIKNAIDTFDSRWTEIGKKKKKIEKERNRINFCDKRDQCDESTYSKL